MAENSREIRRDPDAMAALNTFRDAEGRFSLIHSAGRIPLEMYPEFGCLIVTEGALYIKHCGVPEKPVRTVTETEAAYTIHLERWNQSCRDRVRHLSLRVQAEWIQGDIRGMLYVILRRQVLIQIPV